MAGLTLRSQIGRKLSISEMDGNLTYLESISSGGLPQTALVNNYPAHPSLNNSHIGRCIMFDFNSQQAMLTQSSGATAGNKWSATISYLEGFTPPDAAVWVIDFIGGLNDGDQIGISNMNGLTNYFSAKTTPAYSNEFQIGLTDADTAANFFACLRGVGSDSFCYPDNVSGSQITLVMAVCENHIGSQGNDSNIITTNTANISTAVTISGEDNIMGNWKDNIFSWHNSSGLSSYITLEDLCYHSNLSGSYSTINGLTFPTNAEALANNLKDYLSNITSDFSINITTDGTGKYSVNIEAVDFNNQDISLVSAIPKSTQYTSVPKNNQIPALVYQQYIGVLRGVSNGVATVDSSPFQELVLGNSTFTFDNETNPNFLSKTNDYLARLITPYDEGKCIPLMDLIGNDEPGHIFFDWLRLVGTIFISLTKIQGNTPDQILTCKERLFLFDK